MTAVEAIKTLITIIALILAVPTLILLFRLEGAYRAAITGKPR